MFFVCIRVCMRVRTYIRSTCVCMCVCMRVFMYLFIYLFIHLHLGLSICLMYVHVRRNVKVLAVLNISIKIRKHVEGNGRLDNWGLYRIVSEVIPETLPSITTTESSSKETITEFGIREPPRRAAVFEGTLSTPMIVA